jgi:hypothetical protein
MEAGHPRRQSRAGPGNLQGKCFSIYQLAPVVAVHSPQNPKQKQDGGNACEQHQKLQQIEMEIEHTGTSLAQFPAPGLQMPSSGRKRDGSR